MIEAFSGPAVVRKGKKKFTRIQTESACCTWTESNNWTQPDRIPIVEPGKLDTGPPLFSRLHSDFKARVAPWIKQWGRQRHRREKERKKDALSGCISLWSEVCWMWQRALLSSRNKDPGCSFFMNQSTRRGAVTQPNFSSQTAEHLTWGNSVTWFDW